MAHVAMCSCQVVGCQGRSCTCHPGDSSHPSWNPCHMHMGDMAWRVALNEHCFPIPTAWRIAHGTAKNSGAYAAPGEALEKQDAMCTAAKLQTPASARPVLPSATPPSPASPRTHPGKHQVYCRLLHLDHLGLSLGMDGRRNRAAAAVHVADARLEPRLREGLRQPGSST